MVVLLAPSPRRKSAPASANCMCPVAGHRLRIVFESHANRCDRLAIIPVQCRERSCTARPQSWCSRDPGDIIPLSAGGDKKLQESTLSPHTLPLLGTT